MSIRASELVASVAGFQCSKVTDQPLLPCYPVRRAGGPEKRLPDDVRKVECDVFSFKAAQKDTGSNTMCKNLRACSSIALGRSYKLGQRLLHKAPFVSLAAQSNLNYALRE